MKNFSRIVVSSVLLLASSQAFSQGRIKASCHIDPSNKINGINVDALVPIASVSKLLTAHWAMAKVGPHARMNTHFYITPVENKVIDVHIAGSYDPSFNNDRFAAILGQLTDMGVSSIRNLTFDEKFRFKAAVYAGDVVASNPTVTTPKNGGITPHLRLAVTRISRIYKEFIRDDGKRMNADLLAKAVNMKVGNIDYLASTSFVKSESTTAYVSSSVEIYKILKQMNNNSNNYIANLIFDHLGGAENYAKFIQTRLNFSESHVKLYNGSGYPFYNSAEVRFDNKASCKAITTIAKDLRSIMSNEEMKFADIVAVAGQDQATLNGPYRNEVTDTALIAKTGTANPVVSLAGIASTKKGLAYFAVIVADGTPKRANSGRALIRQEIMKIYKQNGGGQDIAYSPEAFFPIDNNALLKPIPQPTLAKQ